MASGWLNRAKKNLFHRSEEKVDFQKAREEWLYKGLEDNECCEADCELCNHEEIRYEYTIINQLNDNTMVVGSACIKKFTEDFKVDFYDINGELVDAARLTKDKNEYLKKVLHEALDRLLDNVNNDFYRSIANQIKKDGQLTPKQLKYLGSFYKRLDDMGQQAFRNIVKVRLNKSKDKEEMENLKPSELKFVAQFMTSQQRETYNVRDYKSL